MRKRGQPVKVAQLVRTSRIDDVFPLGSIGSVVAFGPRGSTGSLSATAAPIAVHVVSRAALSPASSVESSSSGASGSAGASAAFAASSSPSAVSNGRTARYGASPPAPGLVLLHAEFVLVGVGAARLRHLRTGDYPAFVRSGDCAATATAATTTTRSAASRIVESGENFAASNVPAATTSDVVVFERSRKRK